MYSQELIEKARYLRKNGHSYGEIKKILNINKSKTLLFYWCRDVVTPPGYLEKVRRLNLIQLNKVRPLALLIKSKKRKEYLNGLIKRNEYLLKNIDLPTQKLLLAVLYLSEGAKYKGSKMLKLGSTDENIIRFFLKMLKNCYNTLDTKFRVRIQCRFDQNIKNLEDFWQEVTGIKKTQFYPTYMDKRTEGKSTLKKDYKGICTIHYFNTEIQLELELLASKLMKSVISGAGGAIG